MVMGAVQALQRAIQCIEKVRYEETGKGLTKVIPGATFTNASLIHTAATGRNIANAGVFVSNDEADNLVVTKITRDGSTSCDEDTQAVFEALLHGFGRLEQIDRSRLSSSDTIRPGLTGLSFFVLSQLTFLKTLKDLSEGPQVRVRQLCTLIQKKV